MWSLSLRCYKRTEKETIILHESLVHFPKHHLRRTSTAPSKSENTGSSKFDMDACRLLTGWWGCPWCLMCNPKPQKCEWRACYLVWTFLSLCSPANKFQHSKLTNYCCSSYRNLLSQIIILYSFEVPPNVGRLGGPHNAKEVPGRAPEWVWVCITRRRIFAAWSVHRAMGHRAIHASSSVPPISNPRAKRSTKGRPLPPVASSSMYAQAGSYCWLRWVMNSKKRRLFPIAITPGA